MKPTPSDLIVLHPDGFTEEGGMLTRKVDLPDGRKLASERLGRSVIEAALLAHEAAGGMRLAIQEGKALFGLMRTRKLMALPARLVEWPAGSLEAAVAAVVATGPAEVAEVVQAVIGEEQYDPAASVVVDAQRGMAARGLLQPEQAKVMKVFTVTRFTFTPAGREAAAAGPDEAQALLARAQADRPDVWKELERAVRSAIAFKTESSSD